MRRTLHNNASM